MAVKPDGDPNRKRVTDEVKKFLAKKSLLKDPETVKTYTERLGYFLDWCERSGIKHLDQMTADDDLLPYVSFLRQRKTARDTLFEPRLPPDASKSIVMCTEQVESPLRSCSPPLIQFLWSGST